MTSALVSFSVPSSPDLSFSDAGFSATSVTVTALTEAGESFLAEHFGAGAVGAELKKGYAIDFAMFATNKGLGVHLS